MKTKSKAQDWADREADRLFEFMCDALTNENADKARSKSTFELASSLRQAAHNHLMFDATKGIK
jgi:hypothetical protein